MKLLQKSGVVFMGFILNGAVSYGAAFQEFKKQAEKVLEERSWQEESSFSSEAYSSLRGALSKFGVKRFLQGFIEEGVLNSESKEILPSSKPMNHLAQLLKWGHMRFGGREVQPHFSLNELRDYPKTH